MVLIKLLLVNLEALAAIGLELRTGTVHLDSVFCFVHEVFSLLLLLLLVVMLTLDIRLVFVHTAVVLRHLVAVSLPRLQTAQVGWGVCRFLVSKVLSRAGCLAVVVTVLWVELG